MSVGPARGWVQVEGIDGWVTTAPGVLLTVTVADCIPVYLAVPGKAVALLHAGWRGTAGGILARGARAPARGDDGLCSGCRNALWSWDLWGLL